MILKYLATVAIAVLLVTFAASALQFATRSQVLSGTPVDETLRIEFTIDADSSHTYKISPAVAQFLRDRISFHAEGPARVISAKVEVTPKDVTWTENRQTITSTGAAMTAQLRWDTPADSANGAHGSIYLDFPEVPGLEGKTVSFRSGGYQKDNVGRYVIRGSDHLPKRLPALPGAVPVRSIGWLALRDITARIRLGLRIEG
jgi:hypothetical protein